MIIIKVFLSFYPLKNSELQFLVLQSLRQGILDQLNITTVMRFGQLVHALTKGAIVHISVTSLRPGREKGNEEDTDTTPLHTVPYKKLTAFWWGLYFFIENKI